MKENKINIAELLKDCPKGMELDCILFNNPVKYDDIDIDNTYPIKILTENDESFYFTKEGYLYNVPNSKCLIFPKGKTTWEGFHKPFKDGDIVAFDAHHLQIFIFKDKKENNTLSNCYLMLDVEDDELYLEDGMYYVTRFATEEEKQKLFDAIKANGYKWNAETKTLEKFPKFQVGDKIKHKDSGIECTLGEYSEGISAYRTDIGLSITYKGMEQWELAPNKFDIDTLVPFESRVLVRNGDNDIWKPAIFGCYIYKSAPYYVLGGTCWKYCIPYEGNKHLLRTTNDCDDYYKIWVEA